MAFFQLESISTGDWIFIITSGILPALIWLTFWLNEDNKKPEPAGMILWVFLTGALMIFPAAWISSLITDCCLNDPLWLKSAFILPSNWYSLFVITAPLLLIWSAIEEIAKYSAVIVSARFTPFYDEPVDAIIYLITAALGFAAAENIFYLIQPLSLGENYLQLLVIGNLRFLGSTILHTASSAILGGFLALSFYADKSKKILAGITGLTLAIGLHWGFNFFIIAIGEESIISVLIFLWLLIVGIIFLFEKIKKINFNT
ncbi:MAG: PrsW family intramembrane metalloprotease [Patescibacteria group bacterium]